MSHQRQRALQRLAFASFSLLTVAACSTVIGLGDYQVGPDGNAGSSAGGTSAGSSEMGGALGVAGTTVIMKPDGGLKTDAGGKPEGGSTSIGEGGMGEAGAPEGGGGGTSTGGVGTAGSATAGTGGSGTGGSCPGGCDDGIACTIDLCDQSGCVHTPVDAICSGACMKCNVTLGCQDSSTSTELLTNGNLDTGSGTGWAQSSENTDNDVADTLVLIKAPPAGVTAKSAPNVAVLGVKNDEASFITQPLHVPANAVALTLTGFVQVRSTDTVAQSDQAWIDLITDPTDPSTYTSTFSSLWFNDDAGTTWVPFSENADMTAIQPGQDIWFTVFGLNDVSDISNFYFDSLSLKAKVCQ
jgi:hypothetical protein